MQATITPLLIPYRITQLTIAHHSLIRRLAAREFAAKWRGTLLGFFWSFATPLLAFLVYSFAFGVVFRARWTGPLQNTNYPLVLFSGLIVFTIFSEVVVRAPNLILENVSYVKKVVFPLEILPIVSLIVALANAGFAFVVLLAFQLALFRWLSWACVLLPLILLPYCLICLGVSWLLASLGVFLRDLRQVVPVLTSLLMFLTPVFYDPNSVPERYRWIILGNPMTPTFDQVRAALFGAGAFDARSYAISWALGIAFSIGGYFWFMRTRRAFADVI